MFLPFSPLATHRGVLFSAFCTHTHHGEVRDLKSFETPLDFYLQGLFFSPLYGGTTGQVEIFIHLGEGQEAEEVNKEKSKILHDLSEIIQSLSYQYISKHLLNTSCGLHQHSWLGTARLSPKADIPLLLCNQLIYWQLRF